MLIQISHGYFSSWRRAGPHIACPAPIPTTSGVEGRQAELSGWREGRGGTGASGCVVAGPARVKEKGSPLLVSSKSQVIWEGNGTVTSVLSLWNRRCSLRTMRKYKRSTKDQNFESSTFLILTQVMQKFTLQGSKWTPPNFVNLINSSWQVNFCM